MLSLTHTLAFSLSLLLSLSLWVFCAHMHIDLYVWAAKN